MLQTKAIFLASVAIWATSTLAQAELITNGSFETPSRTAKTYGTVGMNDITGWTASYITSANGNIFGNFAAEDGSQCVVLTASNSGGASGTITQTISTTVGTEYLMTFWYSALSNGNSKTAYLTYNVIDSSGVNNASSTLSIDTNGINNLNLTTWTQATVTFVATAASTTVSFTGTNISSQSQFWYGVALDNVSVNAVPEPSATMLFGVGIGGMLAYAARKRRT